MDGISALIQTNGNADCHLILRGGDNGPNYDSQSIGKAVRSMADQGLPEAVMIDASHGNSNKDYRRQSVVCDSVCGSIEQGMPILGVMLESHLQEGRQECGPLETLKYGISVTDSCISWETTVILLEKIALANKNRKQAS